MRRCGAAGVRVGEASHPGPDADEVCAACQDVMHAEDEVVRWPRCHHRYHAQCMIHHARARRPPLGNEIMPSLTQMRFVLCPLCRQSFGTDEEAQAAHNLLTEAGHGMDTAAYAEEGRAGRADHSNEPGSAEQPEAPQGIYPLCHHLRTGPPDFMELPDRRMHWAPTAIRNAPDGGHQITEWMEEWCCNSCNQSVDLVAASPTIAQPYGCSTCAHAPVWAFDANTAAGEWRCLMCDAGAFVRPVQPTALSDQGAQQ